MKLKNLLFVVKVEGESAFPELIPGRKYLATSLKRPKIGRFIVFKNPRNEAQIMVKKVTDSHPEGFSVSGVVSWGTSSKELGIISPILILGTIW